MTSLLAIVADMIKDTSSNWMLAATLPPFLYLLAKNKKQGWLKNLFLKWAIKRTRKQAHKKGKMSDGVAILLAILLILGIGALAVWLLGWTWTIIIIVIGLLIMVRKQREREYE